MKKINRILAIVLTIAMALSLAACGHEHTWADATCDAPKTCTDCGETEGEALGHTWADATCEAPKTCTACGATEGEVLAHAWADATCEAPKTCTLCGLTEGEALGHTWTEANYQAPKTCSACGATEGERLLSYFEEYGLDAKLLDKSGEYDLELLCPDGTTTTIVKVTVTDYQTIPSDENHAAADGYEWKIMTVNMHLWDENAQRNGIAGWHYQWNDFYIIDAADSEQDNTGLFENGMAYSIDWNGAEYADGLLRIAESVGGWEQDENGNYYLDISVTVSIRVPVGYDGFVFGLEKSGFSVPAGSYMHENITDNTLLFRFD